MAYTAISDQPDWFQLSAVDQRAAIDGDFDTTYGKSDEFLALSAKDQETARFGHRQVVERAAIDSQFNPNKIDGHNAQARSDNSSFMGQTVDTTVRSHSESVDRGFMVDDLFTDGYDPDLPQQMSTLLQKQDAKPITQHGKRLGVDIATAVKKAEKDGWVNDAMAWGGLALDVLSNPKAVMEVAAESAASMTVGAGGAWMGSQVGSVVPGVGTAVGAAGGMFAAMSVDAAASKLNQKVRDELTAKDQAFTPGNIKRLLDNKEWLANARSDSLKYGGVLGAVDVLLGGIGSKIATLPARAARKAVRQSLTAGKRAELTALAKKEGETVASIIDNYVDVMARGELKKSTFKSKLKSKTASYTGEVAGEPASEAAATASIGEEIKAEDLIYETLGGIGAGPYGASVNTAAMGTKLAKDKAKKTVKAIIDSTPESRAEKKEAKVITSEGKVVTKAAKVESRARTNEAHDQYNKDVEATDPNDTAAVSNFSDPKSSNYNPIKAVDIISKSDAPDTQDRIKAVRKDFKAGYRADVMRSIKLNAKNEEQALGPKEAAEFTTLQNTIAEKAKTLETINKSFEQARDKAEDTARDKVIEPIDAETATGVEVVKNIKDGFGSSGTNDGMTNGDLDTLEARGELSKEEVALVKAAREANIAEQNVAKTVLGKKDSIEAVSNDIYNGMRESDFKGIRAFKQAIEYHLNDKVNDTKSALVELDGLKKFKDAHQLKAKRVLEFFKVTEANKNVPIETVLSTEQLTTYREMQADNPNFKIFPGSGKYVAAIKQEAIALGKEVKLAEALFKADAAQKAPTTQTKGKKAPEQPAVEPAAEIKTPSKATPRIVNAFVQTLLDQNMNDADLAKVEAKIRKERGDAAGDYFRKQVDAGKAPTETTSKPERGSREYFEQQITDLEIIVKKPGATGVMKKRLVGLKKKLADPQFERRRGALKEQATEKDQDRKQALYDFGISKTDIDPATNKLKNPSKDVSTEADNAGSVTDNLDNNLDSLHVTVGYQEDGQPITKPYEEAIQEKDAEIQEYKDILACCKKG